MWSRALWLEPGGDGPDRYAAIVVTVGLTGGIGAGKSTVAGMLAEKGAHVVDADILARRAVEPGTPGFHLVVERFGAAMVGPDGSLDRTALASVVFADEHERRALEEIVHPLVWEQMATEVSLHQGPMDVVVLVVPLMVESMKRPSARPGTAGWIVVDAPEDVCLERLVSGRSMSREDARLRMAAQASREERLAAASVVIDNSDGIDKLAAGVEAAWVWIQRLVPT